jgi:hypothetical protein
MFIRDIPLGIMPNRHSEHDTTFTVMLEPPDSAREERVTALIDIGQFPRHGLREALVDFIETLANDLAFLGERFFEIAPVQENDGNPTLLTLPPGIIHTGRSSFRQVIPEADRRPGDPDEIEIPAELMWHVTLPAALGSVKEHRKLLADLERLGLPVPRFALDGARLGAEVGFDFATSRRAMDIAIERATARWGTIPSFQRIKGSTEYYLFARRLQWNHSQALLREHILAELNTLLKRLELPRVSMHGIPTARQLCTAIEQLHQGRISVEEAMKLTRI